MRVWIEAPISEKVALGPDVGGVIDPRQLSAGDPAPLLLPFWQLAPSLGGCGPRFHVPGGHSTPELARPWPLA